MIDFTNCVEEMNGYKGSEKKKTLIYDNKKYLVKFPDPVREKNKTISYINNSLSEYIGSNIFKLCGFETQSTILGKYKFNNIEKTVCACLDFTDDENELYEFESIALSTTLDKKIGTELKDIFEILRDNLLLDYNYVNEKFWDMIIIDAIIGNTDRHNGNWGFLVNKKSNKISFSPIYDCGSCLNPMLEDSDISKLNEEDIKNLSINCYSCLKENNKKINYLHYIESKNNKECNNAIKRVFNKINIDKINDFIDNISCTTDVRKDFYKNIINYRYNILKKVYSELESC